MKTEEGHCVGGECRRGNDRETGRDWEDRQHPWAPGSGLYVPLNQALIMTEDLCTPLFHEATLP